MSRTLNILGEEYEIQNCVRIPKCIQPKQVTVIPETALICPSCGGKLYTYKPIVPISKTEYINMEMDTCDVCHRFYSKHILVMDVLEDVTPEWITIINKEDLIYRIHLEYAQELDMMLNSLVYVFAVIHPSEWHLYKVVTDLKERNTFRGILHYTDKIARQLMAAAYTGATTVQMNNKEYKMIPLFDRYKDSENCFIVGKADILTIEMRNNGGYYSPDKSIRVYDGLLFAYKTQCLEVISLSYDTKTGIFYVDNRSFRVFTRKFGLPYCGDIDYCNSKRRDKKTMLNEESMLHILGYNVGIKDDLTDYERHELLSQIVEIGYMTIADIANHLEFLINMSGPSHPDSMKKWKSDLKYITEYKLKHEAFVLI